jgi:hypothetical protein
LKTVQQLAKRKQFNSDFYSFYSEKNIPKFQSKNSGTCLPQADDSYFSLI